jgi:hypothetical protein
LESDSLDGAFLWLVAGFSPVTISFLACSPDITSRHLMSSADDRWHEVAVAPLAHRTVLCYTGQSDEL